jgi:hypothetical protein
MANNKQEGKSGSLIDPKFKKGNHGGSGILAL